MKTKMIRYKVHNVQLQQNVYKICPVNKTFFINNLILEFYYDFQINKHIQILLKGPAENYQPCRYLVCKLLKHLLNKDYPRLRKFTAETLQPFVFIFYCLVFKIQITSFAF